MKYTIRERIECSECGSKMWERFTQPNKSGIRCLQCGHESIDRKPEEEQTRFWKLDSDKPLKF